MPCDVRGKDWMDWNDAKVPAATRSSSEKERGWADTPWSWTPGLQNCESASLVLYHLVQRRQWHLLQYYCLESPMDRGAWQAAVHGVAKSRTRLSDFTFMHWRRKWQPTPVFLPGESQGRGSLVGCRLWGRTESDTTDVTQQLIPKCSYTKELKKLLILKE